MCVSTMWKWQNLISFSRGSINKNQMLKKLKFSLFGSELVIGPFLITFSAMATF